MKEFIDTQKQVTREGKGKEEKRGCHIPGVTCKNLYSLKKKILLNTAVRNKSIMEPVVIRMYKFSLKKKKKECKKNKLSRSFVSVTV